MGAFLLACELFPLLLLLRWLATHYGRIVYWPMFHNGQKCHSHPLCRQYFQVNFLERKVLYNISKFIPVLYAIIGSYNCLVSSSQQSIYCLSQWWTSSLRSIMHWMVSMCLIFLAKWHTESHIRSHASQDWDTIWANFCAKPFSELLG